MIKNYGELLYDLCQSLIRSQLQAQIAFRLILKKTKAQSRFNRFVTYERSWLLRVACEILLKMNFSSENREFLSFQPHSNKLEHFDEYFNRLPIEDQIFLILKDRHQIPLSEIASALSIPEESLKIKRGQAFCALEEWLWTSA